MKAKDFIEKVAKKEFKRMSREERREVYATPAYEMHFGLGMYIRNKYIHGKKLRFDDDLLFFPDGLSMEIIEEIKELARKEFEQ